MKILKEFSIVILVAGIISLLVLMKVMVKRDFSGTADTAVLAGYSQSNLISLEQIKLRAEKITILNIGNKTKNPELTSFHFINIPLKELTGKETLIKLRENTSETVIFSDDASLSAKAWVILDQLGIKNLYILVPDNNEELKYQFQPDISVRPE